MTQGYHVALEFAHGQVWGLTNPNAEKVAYPMTMPPDSDKLMALMQRFASPDQLTLVRLNCPHDSLTEDEYRWGDIILTELEERLGYPVRSTTDVVELLRGAIATEDDIRFPMGLIILNDSDSGSGGFARKYVANDRAQWMPMNFNMIGQSPLIVEVGGGPLKLSQDSPAVKQLIQRFVSAHPNITRLFVWSPDGLPFTTITYAELKPGTTEFACSVTTLNRPSLVLSTVLRQGA